MSYLDDDDVNWCLVDFNNVTKAGEVRAFFERSGAREPAVGELVRLVDPWERCHALGVVERALDASRVTRARPVAVRLVEELQYLTPAQPAGLEWLERLRALRDARRQPAQ